MKKIIAIVLAFTVLACAKEEVKPKQFTVFGKWKTEVFNDQVFEMDSAVDAYDLRPDFTYEKIMYRNGGVLGREYGSFSTTASTITFRYGTFSHSTRCLALDEVTAMIEHYDNTWLTLHKQ